MVNPLSRVMMKNIIKDKNPIISSKVGEVVSNLDKKENEILLGIINGQGESLERKRTKSAMTLDEAANRIKSNR